MNAMSYPSAHELSQKLRARRKAKEIPTMPVITSRAKLEPQEEAFLEALLRDGATDDELAAWRKNRQIHHKTFSVAVRRLRERIAASAAPSPMAAQLADLSRPTRPNPPPPAPPAPKALSLQVNPDPAPAPAGSILIQPAAPAAGLDQLVNWLTDLRTVRDQLAAHGIDVEGNLSIRISL